MTMPWTTLSQALATFEKDYGQRRSVLPGWVDAIETTPQQLTDNNGMPMFKLDAEGNPVMAPNPITGVDTAVPLYGPTKSRAPRAADYAEGGAADWRKDLSFVNTVWMGDFAKGEVQGEAQPITAGMPDTTVDAIKKHNRNLPTAKRGEKTPVLIDRALNEPYLWSEKKVDQVMQRMRAAGYDVQTFEDITTPDGGGIWGSLVMRAQKMWQLSKGKRALTPWDVLDMTKRENKKAGILDEDGNVVQNSTSSSVQEISDGDAWSIMESATASALGRKPTHDEIREFSYKANNIAAASPLVTNTRSETNAETGNTSSSSNTSGGITSADLAMAADEKMRNEPEYAKVQAGTTYANAMFAALDSPV